MTGKTKTIEKLNSTEMDFRRSSVRILRRDKIINILITQKMNVTRSLLVGVKNEKNTVGGIQWMDGGRLPKKTMKYQNKGQKKNGWLKLPRMDDI